MTKTLALRALNRATLARQMLLAREKVTTLQVIERLVAMQAQWPRPPFIGLWARAKDFQPADLMGLLKSRKAVRATSMRGTLHLMTAKDYRALRPVLQAMLARGVETVLGSRIRGVDVDELVAFATEQFDERPRTFEDLRDTLERRNPKADIRAMAYVARLHIPLVVVPENTTWGFPTASTFARAESWLGTRLARSADPKALVLRYLAAYGPAIPADMQTWSGLPLPPLKEAFEALRPELATFKNERGKEMFDLPKAPRPGADVAAPVRFLPEFDNLLLAHVDRTRVVAEAHRKSVFLPGLRVAPTFLVDGFVAGTWTTERKRDVATLSVVPFAVLSKPVRAELEREGEALLALVESDARRREIRIVKSGETASARLRV